MSKVSLPRLFQHQVVYAIGQAASVTLQFRSPATVHDPDMHVQGSVLRAEQPESSVLNSGRRDHNTKPVAPGTIVREVTVAEGAAH